MTRAKMRGRLEALEAKARARAADRLPLSDLPGFLFAVLEAVSEEAGPDVGARCGRRIVEGKARRVLEVMGQASPEDLRRASLRPDLWGTT